LKDYRRARRVGITSILCAAALRLWWAGVPQSLARELQVHTEYLLKELETGRNVRFSSSSEGFIPDFVESCAAFIPEATIAPLPTFSGEEAAEVFYAVQKDPDIGALLSQNLNWDLTATEPSVLILHTHSTESYTQQGEGYVETSPWRTLDENYNMLSIGDHVAKLLAQNGISVVQDREIHDYPSYNGSYVHARESIQRYLEEYPGIQLILDLHRDAAGSDGVQLRTLSHAEGKPCAQLMVVLGANHPDYEENLSLGLKLHAQLESQCPGITRPLQLRASRYNQDLSPGALLIEVGAAGNSHEEALLAAAQLAQAILALARGTQ